MRDVESAAPDKGQRADADMSPSRLQESITAAGLGQPKLDTCHDQVNDYRE
jgi:hypothetical protein